MKPNYMQHHSTGCAQIRFSKQLLHHRDTHQDEGRRRPMLEKGIRSITMVQEHTGLLLVYPYIAALACLACLVLYNCYLANGTRSWTHMHALAAIKRWAGIKTGSGQSRCTRGWEPESKQRTEAKERLGEDHVCQAKLRGVNVGASPSHFHSCVLLLLEENLSLKPRSSLSLSLSYGSTSQ
jgi:hypothetical protein